MMKLGPAVFIQVLDDWRNAITDHITNWMSNRPGQNVGFRFLWAMIAPVDIELKSTLQGINDWAPGSPGSSSSALALLGNSRGILQGEAETDAHYAGRLQNWRATTQEMGRSERLAIEIQEYLANTPMVRVIERIYSTAGTPQALYVTAAPDGSTSIATANWDWDSVSGWTGSADDGTSSGATTRGWWSDLWIVIYPCEWAVTGTELSALVPLWGSTTVGLGHAVPIVARDAIVRLAQQWKGAHAFVRAIVWSYDATIFDPASPSASGNPDGTWGPLPNRTGHADGRVRYWEPSQE